MRLWMTLFALALATSSCSAEKTDAADGSGGAPAEGGSPAPAEGNRPLPDPSAPEMNQTAPDVYRAKFETIRGDFVVEVHRDWAPNGADRFYNLVNNGFYDGCKFFRVITGFMVQWGINGDPKVSAKYRSARIPDDKVLQSNTRGRITFATGGPNSRTSQVFINLVNNSRLDGMGFSPFGEVVEGMDEVVAKLFPGYGEGAPKGRGPEQGRIQSEGNKYLEADFQNLDAVIKATILQD